MKYLKLLILGSTALLLCHCASVSTMQTARTLKQGESTHTVGLGFYNSDDFLGGESISLPVLEYGYRTGLMDNLDGGLKLTIIGTLVGDVKYNFYSDDEWAFSTGLGIGYLSFTSKSGDVEQKSTIIDVMLPLYASYDFSKMSSLYGAVKYIHRSISSDGEGNDGSMLTSSLGMKYGQKSGVLFEASIISGLDESFSGSQFNAGYFINY